MTARVYRLGDAMHFATTFCNPQTNQPTSPSAVVLRLLDPNGVEFRPPVFNPSTGVFTATYTPMTSGIWHSRWEGTGVVTAAIESRFEIQPSAFSGAA